MPRNHALVNLRTIMLLAVAVLGPAERAWCQPCEADWEAGLFVYGRLSGPVRAMARFDAGAGEALYLGYDSGQNLIGWDGAEWILMPNMNDPVLALLTFDDGNGDAIYAGGEFTEAQGFPDLGHVSRWDGADWTALGAGLNDTVRALAVFDDGNGPALYAGGDFFEALFEGIHSIARWDGAQWLPLATGLPVFNDLNGAVYALAVFDDGNGEALYVGGEFTLASGTTVNRIARWDGQAWEALGTGFDGLVHAFAVFDDGSGEALYAGGVFTTAGGTPALNIARWDGSIWSEVAGGTDGPVHALYGAAGQPATLWVGGEFLNAGGTPAPYIATWDGNSWTRPGSGLADGTANRDAVYVVASFDGAIHAGGDFALAHPGASGTQDVARWSGADWEPLGQGISGGGAKVAIVYQDGDGPGLYVGGEFTTAGSTSARRIARWDGASWSQVGPGLSNRVEAMAVYDDGGGPDLYVAGDFDDVNGGLQVNNIARWDGVAWSDVDDGILSADIRSLAVFDGTGESELYVGGYFQGVTAPDDWIAKWNGVVWSAVGDGLNGQVLAMAVYDDGSGDALYVGGGFDEAGGIAANGIARWDGAAWAPMGDGVGNGSVSVLAVFDDGSGNALFVGGNFTMAGGQPANYIARWDGSVWSMLLQGTDSPVQALAPFDDGTGRALYVGGSFTMAGGQPADRIARWDGQAWSTLGEGVNLTVHGLAEFDAGSGPDLYAVGSFQMAGGSDSSRIARWNGCRLSCPWDLDDDGAVGIQDFEMLLAHWGMNPGGPPDFDADGTVGILDFLALLANWGPCP